MATDARTELHGLIGQLPNESIDKIGGGIAEELRLRNAIVAAAEDRGFSVEQVHLASGTASKMNRPDEPDPAEESVAAPRHSTPEQRRILGRLGLTPTEPWVWLTTDGPVSPDHARLRVDDGGPPREFPLDRDSPNRDYLKLWDGYSLDLVGVPNDAIQMQLGSWQVWGDLDLDVRYMHVRYRDSALYVEYLASERDEADAAIRGAILPHTAEDLKKALAALDLILERVRSKPGPKPGTGAKFKTPEEWDAALNEHIRPRPKRVTADERWFAERLGLDSPSTLFKYMERWGPKHIRDLREGNF